MAFIASVDFKKRFEVKCPFDRAFDLLSNVPESVSHFPNVEQLVDLGDNAFRWEMRKIGVDRFSIQTIYGCKYVDDREKGTIKWTPVKGEGNGTVKGKWTLKAADADNTRIDLTTTGELEIPLPGLVKFIVAPVVAHEFEKMVDQYVENLSKTLNAPPKKKAAARKK
jgi:carbon monoxide dehydrogenase subunit G